LANVVQKKGESLREFIKRFCNKRNLIPEVDDKSIIMFFKKGLSDSSLIRKLAMKYTLVEEVTLNTREHKKESGHMDQPSLSKGHDKKRKADHSVNTVERSRCNKEY
jgi:hypothetical protein